MLSYLKKILSYDPPEPFVLGESPDEQHEAPQESHIRAKEQKAQYPAFTLSKKLEDMYTQLRRIFGNGENDDLILRIFKAGEKRVFLALLDGLTNKDMTGEIIMKPLMTNGCTSLTQALEEVVPLNGVKEETDPSVVVDGIVNGLVFFSVLRPSKAAHVLSPHIPSMVSPLAF